MNLIQPLSMIYYNVFLATVNTNGLTIGGKIIMVSSLLFVISLSAFCIYKLLTIQKD